MAFSLNSFGALTVTPQSFGDLDPSSPTEVVTFTIESDSTDSDFSYSIFGDAGFSTGAAVDCGSPLVNGNICNLEVAYNPSGQSAGSKTGYLKLVSSSGTVYHKLSVYVSKSIAGLAELDKSYLDFGTVSLGYPGEVRSGAFKLKNVGTQDLVMTGLDVLETGSSDVFSVRYTDCSGSVTLAAGESCVILVQAQVPASASAGSETYNLNVINNEGLDTFITVEADISKIVESPKFRHQIHLVREAEGNDPQYTVSVPSDSGRAKFVKYTEDLGNLYSGYSIEYCDGSLYTTRNCKAVVQFVGEENPSEVYELEITHPEDTPFN